MSHRLKLLLATTAIVIALPATAAAQGPALRLAAPSDCLTNAGCGAGFERVYRLDVRSVLTPLADADGGIGALDDGLADVAVVFSSNPLAGRPDLLSLQDDRGLLGPENLTPVLSERTYRAFGRGARALRTRMALIGRLLDGRDLRAMNQLALDRRLPEPIAGEWVEGHGLATIGDRPRRRPGPKLVFGYQGFDESEIVTRLYAIALEGAGYRVGVVHVGGLRAGIFKAYAKHRINAHVDYATSLTRFLDRSSSATSAAGVLRDLGAAARRRGFSIMPIARAQDTNTFVMLRSVAAGLGIRRLSDLRRYWPAAS